MIAVAGINPRPAYEDSVASKKPSPKSPKPASKNAKGRSRERGDTVTFTFEMTPELDAALQECSDQEDRTKKAILTRSLIRYLNEGGFYPKR